MLLCIPFSHYIPACRVLCRENVPKQWIRGEPAIYFSAPRAFEGSTFFFLFRYNREQKDTQRGLERTGIRITYIRLRDGFAPILRRWKSAVGLFVFVFSFFPFILDPFFVRFFRSQARARTFGLREGKSDGWLDAEKSETKKK